MAATEGWWCLGMPEAVLIPWLVGSLPPQAARDYPVYLPHGSPTVSGLGGAGRASNGRGGARPGLVPQCSPAAGPSPAADPDPTSGPGAVYAVWAEPAPGSAGPTGEGLVFWCPQ